MTDYTDELSPNMFVWHRYKSLRGHVWTDVDKARSGGLPFVFDDNMSFER